ncbi:MAG: SDR family oxidoreductase [Verrucomicrobia bacterium]|nr:SDR family oxidoreductase [Verrucomicrobiota bacterium]
MTFFQKTIAVVTGGASGIGQALCEELARNGATIVVADIDAHRAQQVASAIASQGGRAESAEVDVANAKQMETLADQTVARHGRLDYFFNNAGFGVVGELRDLTPEHWRRLVDVNILGVVHGTMAAYTVMVRQGSGHIVNVASLGGLMPTPVMTPYSTTKWAVVGFSTSLRMEAASLGVKISVACPSIVRTNFPDRAAYVQVNKEAYLKRLPWRFMMEPADAARAILRGVVRNQAIIVCPWHGRLLWWCQRHVPWLLAPLWRMTVREWRTLRLEN